MGEQDRIGGLEQQIEDLKAQLADVRRRLVSAEFDQWRGRIDDLELQTRLGSMGVQDRLMPVVEQLRAGTGLLEDSIQVVGLTLDAEGEARALLRLGTATGGGMVTLDGRPGEQYQKIVGTHRPLGPGNNKFNNFGGRAEF